MTTRTVNASATSGQQGFTLVELAIVLVIIGLIIGGVLVGQDMIKAAQIRSQITQINQINTAVGAFRAKYDCLAGDCATVVTYISTATAGDGNGVITDTNNAIAGDTTDWNAATGEVLNTFRHLQLAGFSPFTVATSGAAAATSIPTNFPRGKVTQFGIIPLGIGGYNWWHIGATGDMSAAIAAANFTNNTMTPYQAQQIDSKMDDGTPSTGSALAVYMGATPALTDVYTPLAGGAGLCIASATAYSIGAAYNDIPLCQIRLRWQN